MSKFKSLFVMLFATLLVGGLIVSCDDNDGDDDNKTAEEIRAEGLAAGTEMCDCVANYEDLAPNVEDFYIVVDTEVAFDQDGYLAALSAYGYQAAGCLGSLQPHEEYVTVNFGAYEASAENPLLSVFNFENDDFKAGFTEGIGSCADAFGVLLRLMGQMQ